MSAKKLPAEYARALAVFGAAVAVALAGVGLIVYAKSNPDFLNGAYRDFTVAAQGFLSRVTSVVPFSIAEILIYLLSAALLAGIVYGIIRLIKKPGRLRFLARAAAVVSLAAAIVFTGFYSLWGLNYQARPLAQSMGLNTEPRGAAELVTLNEYLAENANRLSVCVERDEEGRVCGFDFGETAREVAQQVAKTTGHSEAAAKYVAASVPLSYTEITGMFTFYTGEANVNSNSTPESLPFVMAHETAHRNGIAREDEANFFAFYSLYESDDPLIAYSAYMMALTYCQNKLYAANSEEWTRIWGSYGEELRGDYKAYNEHWRQYEGKVAEVSQTVNNTYLQTQGQQDGVKSYGRMVDLMLAWAESEGITK